ncbi:glycosyltransferase family 2 protein [Marinimicrobium sp. ARAG 43.8]|uniref:glycosyltransferase family 2 protein n=1 Tax=Marinimicrobium sp. ARAG 43.8 TaxID=3418719 RepID=UPI003CF7DDE4
MKFAIAVIVKNESPSLLEWVAYHRAVGVTDFIIIDNYSTDNTWQLVKALRRKGLVNGFRFKTLAGKAPQVDAYQCALKKFGARYDAIAFIDADEYLFPAESQEPVPVTVERLFQASETGGAEVGAICLNWACFGSNGQVFKASGMVLERFVTRAPALSLLSLHYKSIVRPEKVVRFNNPHHAVLAEGEHRCASGAPLEVNKENSFGLSETTCWDNLRVNHYVVKSLEEFLVRKSQLGSAARYGKQKREKFFRGHDRNDEEDRSILPLVPKVQAELERLESVVAEYQQPGPLERMGSALKSQYERACYLLRKYRLYH